MQVQKKSKSCPKPTQILPNRCSKTVAAAVHWNSLKSVRNFRHKSAKASRKVARANRNSFLLDESVVSNKAVDCEAPPAAASSRGLSECQSEEVASCWRMTQMRLVSQVPPAIHLLHFFFLSISISHSSAREIHESVRAMCNCRAKAPIARRWRTAFGSAELHLLCSRIFSAIGFRLKRRKNENREKEKILFACIKGSNLFLKCGEIS